MAQSGAAARYDLGRAHVSDEILVQFQPDADQQDIDALKASLGAQTLGVTALLGIERLRLLEGTDLDAVLQLLANNPLVAIADPHYQAANTALGAPVTPNDPDFNLQWGLENTGIIPDFGDPGLQGFLQSFTVVDTDVDASQAWAHSTGEGVVVAVIDTGIDLDHPDLNDNLWINPGEIAGNGIDDDGNGYIDDIHGFDFGGAEISVLDDTDNDPSDTRGHGTHVAGIIAAEGNNGIGITGLAYDAEIMVLRVNADDSDFLSGFAILEAIEYAAANGARVSNNSYSPIGQFAFPVIEAAGALGHLFVTSAGNKGEDQDLLTGQTVYDLENVIGVAATTLDDTLAGFSNFGATTIDLAAPGFQTLSTHLNGDYAFLSGTSMAAPHVAAAAALALALVPDLTVAELKAAILDTVDEVAALDGLVTTGGRLNVANLVESLLPPPVDDLQELLGSEGNDRLRGTDADERLMGLDGNDRLEGRGGGDILIGAAGNDRLMGGLGADQMIGGLGNDLYFVNEVGDVLVELAGQGQDTVNSQISFTLGDNFERLTLSGTSDIDGTGNALANRITGNNGANTLDGGEGRDVLSGKDGDDLLVGGAERDQLNGGAGADVMRGGADNDRYTVDNAGDVIEELAGEGIDQVNATIDYVLGANVENLILRDALADLSGTGNASANRIIGDAGDNRLEGLEGRDNLSGKDGDDILDGGAGMDRLTGGDGSDTFLFAADGAGSRDQINDFAAGEDVIMLQGLAITDIRDLNAGALITFDSGNSLLLRGVAIADLDMETDLLIA
ncbi:MAG: S8 family serine peptidase [Pseudomonadota bacterium]